VLVKVGDKVSEGTPVLMLESGEAANNGAPAAEAPAEEEQAPAQKGEEQAQQGPPEASFMSLVGSLATQAMLALGVIAPQGQKQVYVDLGQAKYCIDTLQMLRDKTEGNLSEEEAGELTQALAELQQIYVARAQQIQEHEMREAGIDLNDLKGKKE